MAIKTEGNLLPSNTNIPLDSRTRVQSLADVTSIDNPYIGLLFYVSETSKVYVVTGLADKKNALGITIPNAMVGTYEEVSGKDGADGAKGEPGKDGADGADGKDGVTPSITVGNVSVVDDPEQANVSLGEGSTDKDIILDFAIPRGPAGSGADADVLANISTKVDAIDATLVGVTEMLEELVNGGGGGNVVVKTSEDDILKALLVFSK